MALYTVIPDDVLFLRDARPFEAGGGHGARWPDPGILFAALHAALHRGFPDDMPGEHRHRHRDGRNPDNARRDKRFGSLWSAGPFPVNAGTWYFPCPQDVTVTNGGHLRRLAPLPRDEGGRSNLPKPLAFALGGTAVPDKDGYENAWWSKAALEAYLRGEDSIPKDGLRKPGDFYEGEWSTGIGIDPATQAQDKEHLYSAEYLRLKPDVRMGIAAEMPLKDSGGDGLEHLFAKDHRIVVGGQQRVCQVEPLPATPLDRVLPAAQPVAGPRVKWLLLTPSVFPRIGAHPGGWLPTWVDVQTGKVMLRAGAGEGKARRRGLAVGPSLDVRLVAACVPKPLVLSGWSERLHLYAGGMAGGERAHGATPTVLAVPPGAVYYFEGPDAPRLASRLNWQGARESQSGPEKIQRRSSMYGEQGFGIGVCGPWSEIGNPSTGKAAS